MITSRQLYEKLKNIRMGSPFCEFTEQNCKNLLPTIERIETLKREKNAIILAHNYVAPQILYSVADHTGDSYGLALKARESEADVIVFPAVRFMAETAKILNPDKIVLDPNPNGGCTLADGITANDVKRLRTEFPHHTFVCYINTTAEVKALCDTCVTSSNVYKVIELISNDKIYFLPDRLMGENVKNYLQHNGIDKDVELYDGTCYVHEEYQPENVDQVRENYPDVEILVHPECMPEVVNKADYVGSTSGMLNHVRQSKHENFFLLTECGLTGVLESEFPNKKFVGTCTTCRYMKANSLDDILNVLEHPTSLNIIELDSEVQKQALHCVEKMFSYLGD
jgi:quinolinate synthase|tara:strand:- start:549 stop:1565 length:1017 start_codon:yes stop_codon:yes gene_type:complete